MTDIVMLLRENADLDAAEHVPHEVVQMQYEAANEIERLREQVAHLSLYKPARRTEQPISRVHPDYPGDGKPRFKTFGIIVETDEEFAERAGTEVEE